MKTKVYLSLISGDTWTGACSKEDFERNRLLFEEDVTETIEFEWQEVTRAEDFDAWKARAQQLARDRGFKVHD